jgi:hypothetical protein
MSPPLITALKHWFQAVPFPGRVIRDLKDSSHALPIAFWNVTAFGFLYTITVAIFYFLLDHQPTFAPWLPVPLEVYYLGQIFWTIPWALATWILIAGAAHLSARAGRAQEPTFHFDHALAVCGLAWIVPAFYTQWLPETFIFPLFGQVWPDWLDVVRIMVLPVFWQIGLTAFGMRVTHKISWIRAALIGLLATLLSFLMFLVFIR